MAQPGSGLLGLPDEILCMILTEYFQDTVIFLSQDAGKFERKIQPGRAGVLETCRKLYEAAMPILLKTAHFHHTWCFLGKETSKWMDQPLVLAEHVRHVSGGLGFAQRLNRIWKARASNDGAYAQVKKLKIAFSFTFNQFNTISRARAALSILQDVHQTATRRGVEAKVFIKFSCLVHMLSLTVNADGKAQEYEATATKEANLLALHRQLKDAINKCFGPSIPMPGDAHERDVQVEWWWPSQF